jgi:hypothetical protein
VTVRSPVTDRMRGRRSRRADLRARETEQQMTDDERFSLIVSLISAVPIIGVPRCTVLGGSLPDQAALIGILQGLYALGLPLLLVECVEGDDEGRVDAIG